MTDSSKAVAKARQKLDAAEEEIYRIQSDIDREVQAAKTAIWARYDNTMKAAQAAKREAKDELTAAKDQLPDHPWTGKKVFRLVPRPRRAFDKEARYDRIEGVVETVRSTTKMPGNLAAYSRPATGLPIVRLLKKDGTPGLMFEGMGHHTTWKLVEEETTES